MTIDVTDNIIKKSYFWTVFKSVAITSKSLSVQYDEDPSVYFIYAYDGNTPTYVHTCTIYKGTVPDGVLVNYSQSQNDSDKSDFETNYKNNSNYLNVPATADNSANSKNKTPVLAARANTSPPGWTDGYMVPLSVDLSGALRVSGGSNASIGSNGAAIPSSSTQVGGSDGTNLQPIRLFDLDSGGGTQYILGVGLRKAASGGSVELGTSSDPIRIDPTGTTTQPISGTVSISGTIAATQSGTWTVQPGNTANTTPWLTTISQGGNAATVSGAGALKVDGSAVTQPVSGTVTANIGTTNGLALDATLAKLTVAQGASLGTNTQALMGGSVTTAAPTYTTGQISPLSLTTAGALRIDGSGVTQPVSGTVAATQSGTWTVQPGNTANTTPWLTTISQGGNSATVSGAGALKIDGSAVTQPVSGTVTSNQGTANSLANAWSTKITDATNGPVAVKAASTAAVAADPALVVAISPNNPISVSGTADVSASGTLGALNAAVTVTHPGLASVGFQLAAGTLAATLVAEISFDAGTTWSATFFRRPSDDTKFASLSFINPNSASTYSIVGAGGTGQTRVRVSAYTSGTANATVRASNIQDVQPLFSASTSGVAAPSAVLIAGTNSGLMSPVTMKSASTAAVAADTALVVAVSPNNTVSTLASQNGTWTVQPGNTANTTPWLTTISQGGNAATVTGSNALKVDGSAVTQPVSGTVTANAGTGNFTVVQSTASNLRAQTAAESATGSAPPATAVLTGGSVTTAAPTYTTGQMSALSLTTAGGLRIDGSGVTQPVSGTVTANQGGTWNINNISGTITLPTGAATETSLAKLTLAQGSTTSGQSGTLMQGAVTTAAPTYTTAQTSPLSLTTAGALRVDNSANTQPVSGTVTSNQGTANSLANAWSTKITDATNGPVAVKAASTAAVATDPALVVAVSPNNSVAVTQATASNLNAQVVGPGASGAAVSGNPVRVAGSDGANTRNITTDTSGRLLVSGAAADGAAVTGNPVLMAGQDGTNAQSLLTDTTGRLAVIGAAADGAAVAGNPILIGGQDGTNAQSMLTDTTGRPVVVGAGTAGSPVGGIVSTQVPDTTGSGTLNALNATGSVSMAGNSGCSMFLSSGTLIGTIVPELSYDGGTTWAQTLFQNPNDGSLSSSITFSASNGAVSRAIMVTSGTSNVRVRVSLFTSGTASVALRATRSNNTIPVAADQAINTTNAAIGRITTAATTRVAVRATTFVEQSSNAQRSVSSSSASDASAGTGARTIRITYYDSTGAGPFTVDLTMNGTTAVNTGVTNICYVESIIVLTAGSNTEAVGNITLFAATAAGGGAIASLEAAESQTYYAHHYVPTGKTCYITDIIGDNNNASSGSIFSLWTGTISTNVEIQDSGFYRGGAASNTAHNSFKTPIKVTGPAKVILYVAPEAAGSILSRGAFHYYDI